MGCIYPATEGPPQVPVIVFQKPGWETTADGHWDPRPAFLTSCDFLCGYRLLETPPRPKPRKGSENHGTPRTSHSVHAWCPVGFRPSPPNWHFTQKWFCLSTSPGCPPPNFVTDSIPFFFFFYWFASFSLALTWWKPHSGLLKQLFRAWSHHLCK